MKGHTLEDKALASLQNYGSIYTESFKGCAIFSLNLTYYL